MAVDRKLLILGIVVVVLAIVITIAIAVPLAMNNHIDASEDTPLERAKAVLKRVPLVDGYVFVDLISC